MVKSLYKSSVFFWPPGVKTLPPGLTVSPLTHQQAVARLLAMAWKASLKVSGTIFVSPGFPWGSTNGCFQK